MSDESAKALRRKVGGTKSGFFGETVDATGKYLEKGYVSSKPTEVAYLPFIVIVLLGIIAATVAVVSRT